MNYRCLLLFPLISLLLSGCVTDTNAETPLPESKFFEVNSGVYPDNGIFTTKQTKILGDEASYNSALLNYTGIAPATLNFSSGKVLLIDMGQRNSGGYSINATSVDISENYVTVNVRLSIPGESCGTTDALTNPYQFIFVATKKEILISETLTVIECE